MGFVVWYKVQCTVEGKMANRREKKKFAENKSRGTNAGECV